MKEITKKTYQDYNRALTDLNEFLEYLNYDNKMYTEIILWKKELKKTYQDFNRAFTDLKKLMFPLKGFIC